MYKKLLLQINCVAAVQCIKWCQYRPAALGYAHINHNWNQCDLSDVDYCMIVGSRWALSLNVFITADFLGFLCKTLEFTSNGVINPFSEWVMWTEMPFWWKRSMGN